MGSPWSDIARRVSECLDKDHAECDQNICTPDNYPLHWMEASEIALLLKLTDHLQVRDHHGYRRPKTGPDQDTDDHTLDQPDATFPDGPDATSATPASSMDTATDDLGASARGSEPATTAEGPFDHLVDGKTLNEEMKAAQEATNKALDNLRDAMDLKLTPPQQSLLNALTTINPEPDPDFKFDKGEKAEPVVGHFPLATKGEITPSPRGRMRMTYVGVCSCGWESPHRFPSVGGANSSIHQHIGGR